jgi:molybdate transport system substrate-binding protein
LGIVEEMKAKTKYPILGALVGSMLDSGEVDHAVQSIPELIFVQGVDLVGPLPGDLQAITTYAVGVPASAKEPDAARALISLLRSPEAVSIIKAKGLDPG